MRIMHIHEQYHRTLHRRRMEMLLLLKLMGLFIDNEGHRMC